MSTTELIGHWAMFGSDCVERAARNKQVNAAQIKEVLAMLNDPANKSFNVFTEQAKVDGRFAFRRALTIIIIGGG